MYRYRKISLALTVALVTVVLLGCENIPFFKKEPKKPVSAQPPPGAIVVARVGNFYVTTDDLNKEIETYNALVGVQGRPQDKIDTRDKKAAYLRNEMVRKYILYQEALDKGMDKKPEMEKAVENAKITILISELLREELAKIDVSSKEIEDFYNKNKELLSEPEQRKIREIVTDTEEEIKQAYIELLRGADFTTMAKQYSKAATKDNGGDLGFIALEFQPEKRVRFDKFYEVAFAASLEVGGISNIFKGPDGYYIVKLESVKKPEAKSLSDLWDNIKNWLLFDKQQKAIAELASRLTGETKIQIFEDKVN